MGQGCLKVKSQSKGKPRHQGIHDILELEESLTAASFSFHCLGLYAAAYLWSAVQNMETSLSVNVQSRLESIHVQYLPWSQWLC